MSIYNNPMNPMPLVRPVLRPSFTTDELSQGPWGPMMHPGNPVWLALSNTMTPTDARLMNQFYARGFNKLRAHL